MENPSNTYTGHTLVLPKRLSSLRSLVLTPVNLWLFVALCLLVEHQQYLLVSCWTGTTIVRLYQMDMLQLN